MLDLTDKVLGSFEKVIKEEYDKINGVDPRSDVKLSGYDMLKELERRCDMNIDELRTFELNRVIAHQKTLIKQRKDKVNSDYYFNMANFVV